MNNVLKMALTLLLASAIIHLAYPFLYDDATKTNPVAIFGIIYLVLSIGVLFRNKKWMLIAAAVFTSIGMIAATTIYTTNDAPYPLDIVLILIDVVIVPIFWWAIISKQKLV